MKIKIISYKATYDGSWFNTAARSIYIDIVATCRADIMYKTYKLKISMYEE